MLLGVGQGQWLGSADEAMLVQAWTALTVVDFSYNSLTAIDETVVNESFSLSPLHTQYDSDKK